MIHMVQCLCGPARHAIMGILYDDKVIAPEDAKNGFEALMEMQADHGIINRRCEICDKDIKQFWYEDHLTIEQDWDKAVAQHKASEANQTLTRNLIQATRKGARN